MKKRKSVLVVSPVPPPVHGATIAVQLFLESSLASKFRLAHIDSRIVGKMDRLGSVDFRKLAHVPKYLFQMVQRAINGQASAVVLTPTFFAAPFLKDSLYIWMAWVLRRKQIVAWLHTDYCTLAYDDKPLLYRWYARATLRRCTHYVCVADGLQDLLPDYMSPTKRFVVVNGVADPPGASQAAACRAADSDGPKRVVFLANMDEEKGWRVLFEAANRTCEVMDVYFEFYGAPWGHKGGGKEEIEAVFSSSAHANRITYHGFADPGTKWKAFERADLFCLPSFNEALPLTLLEAMAFGLPIVASDVGAIGESFINGEGGTLVPPRDPELLQNAIVELLSSPKRLQCMGAANRKRYEQLFTAEAFAKRWEAFFDDMEDD